MLRYYKLTILGQKTTSFPGATWPGNETSKAHLKVVDNSL